MLDTDRTAIVAPRLRAPEMAQVLAAVVAHESEVVSLVWSLAPRSADPILTELSLLFEGGLAHDAISPALRWILLEIHEEIGRRFHTVLA